MKNLRIIFASLLIAALTTVAFSNKANAQQLFRFDQTVPVATFASNISTIVDQNNWTETSVSCPGSVYLCGLQVSKIVGTNPTPTKAQIFTALNTYFAAQNPITFPGCGTTFVVPVTTASGTFNYNFAFFCKD